MIFQRELCHKIVQGKKTETRRPVKPGETQCRYRLGRSYALQRAWPQRDPDDEQPAPRGRAETLATRIIIQAAHDEPLGDLDDAGARAEGFKTTDEFFDYWRKLYGVEDVDVDQRVWVIHFTVDNHRPRLLTPASRPHGSEHGYTSKPEEALPDEPEVIDRGPLKPWFTNSEKVRAAAQRDLDAQRLRPLTPEERYRELREMAKARGIDVSNDEKAIGRRLDAIERKVRRAAA